MVYYPALSQDLMPKLLKLVRKYLLSFPAGQNVRLLAVFTILSVFCARTYPNITLSNFLITLERNNITDLFEEYCIACSLVLHSDNKLVLEPSS